MNKEQNILLITSQFIDKYISGFTNRYVGLWTFIARNGYDKNFTFLTNDLVWERFFKGFKRSRVEVLPVRHNFSFKFSSRLFYPLYICYLYKKHKCTSVHVSTTVIDVLYLIRVFNFFKIPYCITFASNSIEMAAYGSEQMRQKWITIFNEAKNVDILNPTNDIDGFPFKKFVSPNSFPYFSELNQLEESFYTNIKRSNSIVFCGSIIEQKNPMLALEGFYTYLKRFEFPDDIRLIYIGKGDQLEELTKRIKQVNEEFGRTLVEFAPYAELPEILFNSKIFLSLQDYDNYPSQSLMEAMIFCNSIISIDNGDTSKMVLENNNNVLLLQKDEIELADAINKLINTSGINTLNREFILNYHNPKRFMDYLLEIHQNLEI